MHSREILIQPPIEPGDPIELKYQIDENQRLILRAVVGEGERSIEHELEIDNPFSVTANPNADQDRILEIRGLIPTKSPSEQIILFEELAALNWSVRNYEQAVYLFENLINQTNDSSKKIAYYQSLANLAEETHDIESQVEHLKKCLEYGSSSASFNVTLALEKLERYEEGLLYINQCIQKYPTKYAAYVLKAQLLEALGRNAEAKIEMEVGKQGAADLKNIPTWQLWWIRYAAKHTQDSDLRSTVDAEMKLREAKSGEEVQTPGDVHLPHFSGDGE